MDADCGRPMFDPAEIAQPPIYDSAGALRPFYKADLDRTDPDRARRGTVTLSEGSGFATVADAVADLQARAVAALDSAALTLDTLTSGGLDVLANALSLSSVRYDDATSLYHAEGGLSAIAFRLRITSCMALFESVRAAVSRILVRMRRRWEQGTGSTSEISAAAIGWSILYGATATEPATGADLVAACTRTLSGTGLPARDTYEAFRLEFDGDDLPDILLAAGSGTEGPQWWLCLYIAADAFGGGGWTSTTRQELDLRAQLLART